MLILYFLNFEAIAASCGTCFRDRGDGTCVVDPACYSVTCGTDGYFKLTYNKGSFKTKLVEFKGLKFDCKSETGGYWHEFGQEPGHGFGHGRGQRLG